MRFLRRFPLPGFAVNLVEWLPDARGIVFIDNEEGHRLRLYSMDLGRGKPQPISPEGLISTLPVVSPDGKFAAALSLSIDFLPSAKASSYDRPIRE